MIQKIFLLFIFISAETNILPLHLFFFNNSDKPVEIQILTSNFFCDKLIDIIELPVRNCNWQLHNVDWHPNIKLRVFIDGVPEDTEYCVKKNRKCKLVISNNRVYVDKNFT